jgi:hypothetical protein
MLTRRNRRTLRKTSTSAILSTNSKWTDPGANSGLCSDRPATNRLSHGTTGEGLLCQERFMVSVNGV